MTLPSSGSLSYNTIRAEFGSPSSNVYLSLYYRGGPYTYAIPQNANITTSSTGTIAVNDFYGSASKGPFLQFNGGSYNTGGKAAIQYYGGGGPNLPGISDTSITIGPTQYSVPRFYAVGSGTVMFITGQPDTNITNATTWSQRNFYCYNTSGSLVFQFRCGWAAGRGQQPGSIGSPGQQPRPKGNLVIPASTWLYESTSGYPANGLTFVSDSALSTAASQPTPSFVVGNSSALNQNLVVKAN